MKWLNKKIESVGFEKFSLSLISYGIIFFIIAIVFFFIGECKNINFGLIKADKFGQFGDIIGGVVGSIWALAGVMLFYAAFKKQIEALKDQKDATQAAVDSIKLQSQDLELQRVELQQTREVLKQQQQTIQIQQFENSFYNQINLLNSIIQNIDIQELKELKGSKLKYNYENDWLKTHPSSKTIDEETFQNHIVTHKGKDCFEIINDELDNELTGLSKASEIKKETKIVFLKYESDLSPYCNLIRQIIITIKINKDIDQNYYLNILASQFTQKEISLLRKLRACDIINRIFDILFERHEFILMPLEEEE